MHTHVLRAVLQECLVGLMFGELPTENWLAKGECIDPAIRVMHYSKIQMVLCGKSHTISQFPKFSHCQTLLL